MHVGNGARDELHKDVDPEENEGDKVDPKCGHGPLLGAPEMSRRHSPAACPDADGLC